MTNRITKVYTRTGDDGTTGLVKQERILKSELRIHAIGEVDELNSWLGVLCASISVEEFHQPLAAIQHCLFDIGAELAMSDHHIVSIDKVEQLEQWIDNYNKDLPPLKEFILPGGTDVAAYVFLARAICRRCERHLVALAQAEPINNMLISYLNRLSDFLFVLARKINHHANCPEIFWHNEKDG